MSIFSRFLSGRGGGKARHSAVGMITRTCRSCGRTFTLPENVQHWPDYCLNCRAKRLSPETVTRTCRSCGRSFTFSTPLQHWPKYCPSCRTKRRK